MDICTDKSFYKQVMKLLSNSGHTNSSSQIFTNHTTKQAVYFDGKTDVSLTRIQRSTFQNIHNISYLFSNGEDVFKNRSNAYVDFVSLEISCITSFRSQMAHDVSAMLFSVMKHEASVFFIKHERDMIIALTGFNQGVFLSDWYSIDDEMDALEEIIHVANVSLETPEEYFFDLIYLLGRPYYFLTHSRGIYVYSLLPIDFFSSRCYEKVYRDEIEECINNWYNYYCYEYGDDYVELDCSSDNDLSSDEVFDLMLLEVDDLDAESIVNEFESDYHFDEEEKDEFEYDDLDSEIFKNPVLMVKWIEKISE